MFKELAPLVRHRAVLFTVSHVEDDLFRVNVIPKKITDVENDSLATPVSVTGTVFQTWDCWKCALTMTH